MRLLSIRSLPLVLIVTCAILLPALLHADTTGIIIGHIKAAKTKEPIPYADIILSRNGVNITGTAADSLGNYIIKDIPEGHYDVKIHCIGWESALRKDIYIRAGASIKFNIKLRKPKPKAYVDGYPNRYLHYFIHSGPMDGTIITGEQLRRMPSGSIGYAITSLVPGTISTSP